MPTKMPNSLQYIRFKRYAIVPTSNSYTEFLINRVLSHPYCGHFLITIQEMPDAFSNRSKWTMFFENEDFPPTSLELDDGIFAYRHTRARDICMEVMKQLIFESEYHKLNTGVYEFTL